MVDINSYISSGYEKAIRSNIQPRNLLIQRSTPGSFANLSSSRSVVSRSLGASMGGGAGSGAANSVTDQRKNEKREMQDLNERFAGYIEKVRFLEAQNKKLSDELDALKSRWGKQTTIIKTMYQTDLDQVRRLLDDCEKETQKLQIQVASLEEKMDDLRRQLEDANAAVDESRDKLEKQIQQIAEIESEVHLLRLRSDLLDGDKKYNRNIIARLQESLNRARSDFDAQAAEHDAAEARRMGLEEELAFLKELHEQELRELAAKAYFDSTASNREFWKSEMSSELKKLQEEYGNKVDEMQNEFNLNYSMQIQSISMPRAAPTGSSKEETVRIRTQTNEIRNKIMEMESKNDMLEREIEELKRDREEKEAELNRDIDELRNDIVTMRAEMEAISRELNTLVDAKLGLEMEIAAYRKLLEGETNEEGLRQVVDNMFDSLVTASTTSYGGFNDGFGMGGGAGGMGGGGGGGAGFGGGAGGAGFGGGMSGGMGGGMGGGAGGAGGSSFSSSSFRAGGGGGAGGVGGGSSMVGGRTSYQRSAKGPVSIAECSPDGKFIVLENTGKRKEEMGGFSLKRNVDGKDVPAYTFKADASIDPHSKIKLWVKGQKPSNATAADIETDISDFGSGQNINTTLFNSSGQDRASHVQKTII